MRGIKSFGMLLAASNDAHDVVEPLAPPAGAAPGTRVWFGQQQAQVSWLGGWVSLWEGSGGMGSYHLLEHPLACACYLGSNNTK
jgi:tRNA-binding EMAP/Myf-like protein